MMIKKLGTKIAQNTLGRKWKKNKFARRPFTSACYAMDVNGALSKRRLKGLYEHIEIFHR
jgi:hypothetical protein